MNAMNSLVASSCDLGALGTLVKFKPPKNDNTITPTEWPLPIFIVDKSGSMGNWVKRIIQTIIPNALSKIGYPSFGQVCLIAFDENAIVKMTTVHEMRSSTLYAYGRTKITEAIRSMINCFDEKPDTSFVVYAISDGFIHDRESALRVIDRERRCKRSNRIRTGYCRLDTGGHDIPDTKVLASLATLDNVGALKGVTVQAYRPFLKDLYENPVDPMIKTEQIISEQLSQLIVANGVVLTAENRVIKRFPCDAASSTLYLPTDEDVTFFLTDPNEILKCGENLLQLVHHDISSDSTGLDILLLHLDSRIRHLRVGGFADMHEEADKLLKCVEFIDSLLDKCANIPSVTAVEDYFPSLKAHERLKIMRSKASRKYKQIIHGIKEIGNDKKVSQLNDKQQAQYLTTEPVCKSLAIRAAKIDPTLDYDELCNDALRRLKAKGYTLSPSSHQNGYTSYFSCDTFTEIIEAAHEAAQQDNGYSLDELMMLVGGVGVAFRSKHADLPDPWQFRVEKVYCGNNHLSECDLQSARVYQKHITYPGFGSDAVVTGVLPLVTIDEAAYRTYTNELKEIAEFHASLALRGRFARIPGDIPARIAGVLVQLCHQIGPSQKPTEPQERLLNGLYRTSVAWCESNLTKYSLIVEALNKSNPENWLTGEEGYNVSSSLKPLFLLLASPKCKDVRENIERSQRVMRALYTLHVYFECRRKYRTDVESRTKDIRALLGIDFEKYRVPVGEHFDQDQEYRMQSTLNYSKSFDALSHFEWLQEPIRFASILRCIKIEETVDVRKAYGINEENLFRLTAAVEALQCVSENDRVDKTIHVSKGPNYADGGNCREYVEKMFDRQYRLDYEQRMEKKKTFERDNIEQQWVHDAVHCNDLNQFVLCLNRHNIVTRQVKKARAFGYETKKYSVSVFKDRHSPNYLLLQKKVLENENAPLRGQKLWVMITGHYPFFEALEVNELNKNLRLKSDNDNEKFWSGFRDLVDAHKKLYGKYPRLKVAWAKGNASRKNMSKLKRRDAKICKDFWHLLQDYVDDHKIHVYRKNIPNRHGHGELKPSFWAMGYSSIADMAGKLEQRGEEGFDELLQYSEEHRECCGFS